MVCGEGKLQGIFPFKEMSVKEKGKKNVRKKRNDL